MNHFESTESRAVEKYLLGEMSPVERDAFADRIGTGVLIENEVEPARGGAAELYRQGPGQWRVVWAQDLRGRRPWTWGVDTR